MEDLIPSKGTKHKFPMAAVPDRQLPLIAGRYEVVSRLTGGMGLVFLCRDQATSELVALKTFKPEYLSHRVARDLFLREGTMWVELGSHPNIVRAHRVERIGDGREVYLVLEWIVQPKGKDNPSLRAWLRPGRPLRLQQALAFALHITRGMKYATRKLPGLVHRDLKPENVLIGHDEIARVTDFGLASTLTGVRPEVATLPHAAEYFLRTQLTQGVVGTPLYMAPEQWQQQPVDSRADIYALGCILYEMLSGRYAADGQNKAEIRDIHLSGSIKAPPALLPREVAIFLRNCLMVNPDQRYRDWSIVENALVDLYHKVINDDVPSERLAGDSTRLERVALGQSYNSMGMSYLDIGKLDVAVMYFEQAILIARSERSLTLESAGLGNLGLAYRAMGFTERAVEFHEEQLSIAHEIGDRAEQGRSLGELGRDFRALGDAHRAARFHEQQLAIAREIGDRYKEAAALDSLALTYQQLGNIERAVALNKQTLAIAKEIGDQVRVKSVLSNMGRIYLEGGDAKEAVALFKQSLDIAFQLGDHVGEGEAYGDLGDLYRSIGQLDRAVELYRRALQIAKESKNGRKEVDNLCRLGDLYLENGGIEKALAFFTDALEIAQQMNAQSSRMMALGKLGEVNMQLGDYMKAASFHKRQLLLARELNDHHQGKLALVGIGTAYERWGDPTRAINYFERHLKLSRQEKNWPAVAEMLYALGERYHKTKQLALAYAAYEEYVAIVRQAEDYTAVGDGLNKMGNVVRDSNNAKEAIDLYKEAESLAKEQANLAGEAWAVSNMSIAYNLMGKQWQASRHADRALKLAIRSGDIPAIARTNYRQALVIFRQEKSDKALPFAQQARQLYERLKDQEMLDKTDRLLAAIEKRRKKTGIFS
ncbi:MAG: serine/threonine-protein kinase [Candidatus Promineifilaceae bacterium]|nr:tetratricopeptide repeat protein [Chloroflexota bacterium]